MKQLPNEVKPSKTFLDFFPEKRRSWVMQRFLARVRLGCSDPQMIVAKVWAEATAKAMLPGTPEEHTKYMGLCLAIKNHEGDALALGLHCLWWESLSPDERSRLRTAANDQHRAAWMQRQPAAQKQVLFLRQLGHRGPVGDRLLASKEISRRLEGARR